MGLLPSSIKLLIQFDKKYHFEGPVLSLGNQEIWANYKDLQNCFAEMGSSFRTPETLPLHSSYMFSNNPTLAVLAKEFVHARVFFEMMGITEYADMDKFESDHPTILHDLNLPVPAPLREKYSLILDGGTIEHIFDIKQVMTNIVQMLKPGGNIVHISSYSMDHGFFGLSPCLFYDFYNDNGFEDFSCYILQVDFNTILETYKNNNPYFEYKYGMPLRGLLDIDREPLIFFVARKAKELDEIQLPIQGVYKSRVATTSSAQVQDNQSVDRSLPHEQPGILRPIGKAVHLLAKLGKQVVGSKNPVVIKKQI